MEKWIKKKGRTIGTKENILKRIDENGELLEFAPIKINQGWNNFTCKHIVSDFPTISEIIIELKPKIIIELGTGGGGVSCFFAETIKPWNGIVHTFDKYQDKHIKTLTKNYNVIFHEEDCVNNGPNKNVIDIISNENILLYCDNGSKELEIKYYSKYLKKGSVIGCHDYDTEVNSIWIEKFLKDLNFKQFHHDKLKNLSGTIRYVLGPGYQSGMCAHIKNGGSLSRFWKKS